LVTAVREVSYNYRKSALFIHNVYLVVLVEYGQMDNNNNNNTRTIFIVLSS